MFELFVCFEHSKLTGPTSPRKGLARPTDRSAASRSEHKLQNNLTFENDFTKPTLEAKSFLFHVCDSSCGRVVKASDSKSDSLWERRFESCRLRICFTMRQRFSLSFQVRADGEHFLDLTTYIVLST